MAISTILHCYNWMPYSNILKKLTRCMELHYRCWNKDLCLSLCDNTLWTIWKGAAVTWRGSKHCIILTNANTQHEAVTWRVELSLDEYTSDLAGCRFHHLTQIYLHLVFINAATDRGCETSHSDTRTKDWRCLKTKYGHNIWMCERSTNRAKETITWSWASSKFVLAIQRRYPISEY